MDLSNLSAVTLETNIHEWQYADYYELHSHQEGWSSAHLTILPRKITNNSLLAFINLVGSLAIEGEQWVKSESNLKIKEFLHFFSFGGYLSNLQGYQISVESFWIEYIAIFNGIKNNPQASFFKNRILCSFVSPINKDDILEVCVFDDKWNQKLYFFKMKDSWGVFDWGTTA